MRRLALWFVKLLSVAGLAAILQPFLEPLVTAPKDGEQAAKPQGSGAAVRVPRPGWSRPKPRTTPPPTYWPALVGLAIAFTSWGIISNIFVFGLGLLLLLAGASGWIGDLLDEA